MTEPVANEGRTSSDRRIRRAALALACILAFGLLAAAFWGSRQEEDLGPAAERAPRAQHDLSASPFGTLGFYTDNLQNGGLDEFFAREAWLNRDVRFFTAFGESRSLEGFRANAAAQFNRDNLGRWAANGEEPPFRLVYSVPLAFGEFYDGTDEAKRLITQQWDALIEGGQVPADHPFAADLDVGVYRDFARDLVALGYGNAVIRLASEHDLEGSRWSSRLDYESFKRAFRVVVEAMRAEAPDLAIDFTSILRSYEASGASERITDAYPGDDYVDIIGVDVYDLADPPDFIGVRPGDRCGWRDPEAVFDREQLPELEGVRRFAGRVGKPISVPEWGLSGGGTEAQSDLVGQCGGDNPAFVANLYDWMAALPPNGAGSLAYHSYFEGDAVHDGPHNLDAFPDAKARFEALYGD